MNPHAKIAFGAALLVSAACALAQNPLYKLKQPDGRVVYSSSLLPGMEVEKELPSSVPGSGLTPVPSAEAQGADGRLRVQISKRDELWRARNQARDDLAAARAAKADGEEPLPGERTGIASGRARLNDAYWARQDELRKAVERAEQRLERAERALRDAGS